MIDASDGVASEFALSPKTPSLASGQSYAFDPSVAIFWGQAGAHPTMDNLTITYNCFLVVSDAWQSALQAAANAAAMIGGMAGQYGWAFGLASAAASTAAAALQATSGDMQRLNVQQTIGRSDLLDLAGGRTWTIEAQRSGSDLVLTVESWGCAAGRPR